MVIKKINKKPTWQRGLSSFCFPCQESLVLPGATGSALVEIFVLCLISHSWALITARELHTGLFVIRAKQDALRKQLFLMSFGGFSECFKLLSATQLLGIEFCNL